MSLAEKKTCFWRIQIRQYPSHPEHEGNEKNISYLQKLFKFSSQLYISSKFTCSWSFRYLLFQLFWIHRICWIFVLIRLWADKLRLISVQESDCKQTVANSNFSTFRRLRGSVLTFENFESNYTKTQSTLCPNEFSMRSFQWEIFVKSQIFVK